MFHLIEHTVVKPTESLEETIKLWVLRILFKQNAIGRVVGLSGFTDPDIESLFNLEGWGDKREGGFDKKLVIADLHKQYLAYEERSNSIFSCPTLSYNIEQLAKVFNLSEVEKKILDFAVILYNEDVLDAACSFMSSLSASRVNKALASILDCDELDVSKALSVESRLIRTGLIQLHPGVQSLGRKLGLLSSQFAEVMMLKKADAKSLFKGSFGDVSKSTLTLQDYSHFQEELDLIIPFLQSCTYSQRKGVNIFIHGKPGTGKTELVKVIAEHLNRELFEVSSEDCQGDAIGAAARFSAYASAQSFLSDKKHMLLFDEVEDVLSEKPFVFGRTTDESAASKRKRWLNNLLENSDIPTIWVSNYAGGIDPAFVRRFNFFFELGMPSKSQKIELLNKNNADLLDEPTIEAIAECTELSPAQIDACMSVLHAVTSSNPSLPVKVSAERIFNQQLVASGIRKISIAKKKSEHFNVDYLNTQMNARELIQGLAQSTSARLCFYGAPGTGKTAFGHHIAAQLEMPLILKKISDLESKFVGEMEQNIARAFADASASGAILQIDEVDSFLQDRRGANQSWEVSRVNEMLTQMESFEGIFIASTNLMNNLDPAVLRRFDLKLEFHPLSYKQQLGMLKDTCELLGIEYSEKHAKNLPSNVLTLGDFNVVKRQNRFAPLKDMSAVVDLLCQEAKHKVGLSKPIGFIH